MGVGPGMGVLLPIMFSEGVVKGRINLETMVKVLSENAARALGIYPQKGAIVQGADADLVIIDPQKEMTINADNLNTQSDFCIYEGWKEKVYPS